MNEKSTTATIIILLLFLGIALNWWVLVGWLNKYYSPRKAYKSSSPSITTPSSHIKQQTKTSTQTIVNNQQSMCWHQNQLKASPNNTNSRMTVNPTSRRRPRVSFRETCTVQIVEPRSSLSEQDLQACYYTPEELESFHSEARVICKNLLVDGHCNSSSNDDPTHLRGFELRTSLNRQKRKYLTLQCVLMAQKKATTPAQLAALASRCTAWAVQVAATEARRDFLVAYEKPEIYPMLPQLPAMTPFPIPLKQLASGLKKRTSCGSDAAATESPQQTCRRVRQKTSCC